MRATKANIYIDNLRSNITTMKSFIKPGVKMCAAVKADGYGHGAVQVAKAALEEGVSFLAVATVQEGIELRDGGITAPILILSLPLIEEIPQLVVHAITPLVFDTDFINALNDEAVRMNRRVPVHLKIDTGMGRVGCKPHEVKKIAELITGLPGLFLEGCCTHFAASESLSETDMEYTAMQFSRFKEAVNAIKEAGMNPGIVHCANTGAIFLHPETHWDMVRPGIGLYGYFPDPELGAYLSKKEKRNVELKPVMELRSQVVAIKHYKKGDSISYGRTWIAEDDIDVGVLPVGYADGLLRRYSPGLTVTVKGKKYPVVGRICMDQCMINLGKDHDVERWDEAVLFGPAADCADADDLADAIGTISYEVTCGINKRVPRIYL